MVIPSYHNPDFQHMTVLINHPNAATLQEWKSMPPEYVIDAINILPFEQRADVLLHFNPAQNNYLLLHYRDLDRWEELPVFRHASDPFLEWTDEEFGWLSTYNLDEAFQQQKADFLPSLEQHTLRTGIYHVLCFDLSYEALTRITDAHPAIWNDFVPMRLFDLYCHFLNNLKKQGAALFLFEKGVDYDGYWAELINKGLFTSQYNPIVLRHPDKAPDGFARRWICNLDDSEASMNFFGKMSEEEQKEMIHSGTYNIWTKNWSVLEQYVNKDIIKKHINEYFIDKKTAHHQENLAWIYDNFRGNSLMIRDCKKAQACQTLGEVVRQVRGEELNRVHMGNYALYYVLTLSVHQEWLDLVHHLYDCDGKTLLANFIDDIDDKGIYHPAWDCPLPFSTTMTVTKEEAPLYL